MNHCVELASVEPGHQFRRRHEIGDLAVGEIAPLAIATEHVVNHDIGASGLVEARDHVRPNETGAAGNQ